MSQRTRFARFAQVRTSSSLVLALVLALGILSIQVSGLLAAPITGVSMHAPLLARPALTVSQAQLGATPVSAPYALIRPSDPCNGSSFPC